MDGSKHAYLSSSLRYALDDTWMKTQHVSDAFEDYLERVVFAMDEDRILWNEALKRWEFTATGDEVIGPLDGGEIRSW